MTRFLEDELNMLLRLSVDSDDQRAKRNLSIAMTHFGFDGKGGCSMEQAGAPHSLTRESVRQITNRIADAIRNRYRVEGTSSSRNARARYNIDSLPTLSAAIRLVESMVPASVSQMDEALAESGLVSGPFGVQGVINAAALFGLPLGNTRIVKHNNKAFVISSERQAQAIKDILSRATKEVSHNGACSIDRLPRGFGGLSREQEDRFIRGVVMSKPGFQWIDEQQRWFYFGDQGRNRLLDRMERVFSFIESAKIGDLREGIVRAWRKSPSDITHVLDSEVMLAVLAASGEYEIEPMGIVRRMERGDPKKLLRPIELDIANFIASSQIGIRREKEMEDALVKNDSEKWAFSNALNYSPLLMKISYGSYTLVGTPHTT